MERIADNTIAHGLRQHSIGDVYPAIIVGRGINPTSWEVHLGRHFCPRLTHESASKLAAMVAETYRKLGWNAAVRLLTGYAIRVGVNS